VLDHYPQCVRHLPLDVFQEHSGGTRTCRMTFFFQLFIFSPAIIELFILEIFLRQRGVERRHWVDFFIYPVEGTLAYLPPLNTIADYIASIT